MAGRSYQPHDDHRSIHRVPPQAQVHPAVAMMEDRYATQDREIRTLFHENQRIAVECSGLKQQLFAAQEELRRLSFIASAVKAEGDAEVRAVYERLLRMEAEVHAADKLRSQWAQVCADVEQMSAHRNELAAKLKEIDDERQRILPEVKRVEAMKAEIDAMHDEVQRGRAAVEHERQMHAIHNIQSQAMEKHMASMDAEIEKLHTELEHAEKREWALAVAASVLGPDIVIRGSGYGQNLYQNHAVQEFHGDGAAASSRHSAGAPSDPHIP